MALTQCTQCLKVYDVLDESNPTCPHCGNQRNQPASFLPRQQNMMETPQASFHEAYVRQPSEWERNWKSNPITAFILNAKSVITNPVGIFERMTPSSDHLSLIVYTEIVYAISAIPLFILNFLITAFTDQGRTSLAELIFATMLLFFLGFLSAPLWLYISSGIMHLIYTNVGGSNKNFLTTLTLRVHAYTTNILSPIPFFGVLAIFVYDFIILIAGGSKIHEIDTGKSALCVVLYFCLCCCLVVGLYFAFASALFGLVALVGAVGS